MNRSKSILRPVVREIVFQQTASTARWFAVPYEAAARLTVNRHRSRTPRKNRDTALILLGKSRSDRRRSGPHPKRISVAISKSCAVRTGVPFGRRFTELSGKRDPNAQGRVHEPSKEKSFYPVNRP